MNAGGILEAGHSQEMFFSPDPPEECTPQGWVQEEK